LSRKLRVLASETLFLLSLLIVISFHRMPDQTSDQRTEARADGDSLSGMAALVTDDRSQPGADAGSGQSTFLRGSDAVSPVLITAARKSQQRSTQYRKREFIQVAYHLLHQLLNAAINGDNCD
jgi:hypothetical protein